MPEQEGFPFHDFCTLRLRQPEIHTLEKVLRENPKEYAVVKLMPEVYMAVEEVVKQKIQAFGTSGKAVR